MRQYCGYNWKAINLWAVCYQVCYFLISVLQFQYCWHFIEIGWCVYSVLVYTYLCSIRKVNRALYVTTRKGNVILIMLHIINLTVMDRYCVSITPISAVSNCDYNCMFILLFNVLFRLLFNRKACLCSFQFK